jgi:Flp pilus assembly protein TadG
MLRVHSENEHKRGRKGQAILELAIVLPILAVLLAAVIALGPLIYMHIATQQASFDCAVAAAQSLDESQGYMQGIYAAQASFGSFNVNPGRANISVRGNWDRNGMVVCEIAYSVPTGAFPFHAVLSPPSVVRYSTSLPTHVYKSEWR